MDIIEALDINLNKRELICLVGGGGKTTTMFAIAQALKAFKKRVLVTTSTHICYPDPNREKYDTLIVDNTDDVAIFTKTPEETVTVFGTGIVRAKEKKLAGASGEFIEKLYLQKTFDYILVECDGSKRKPIKAPASYEPVVPGNATKAIGVIGLDAIGNPINEEFVHRLDIFCDVVKRLPGEMLDEEAVVNLILSPAGLFKGVPEGCKKYVLLNKAEILKNRKHANNISARLKIQDNLSFTKCIIAAMVDNKVYS
ncbi:MAG: putative selenium-dependent hydroxylase accessory protein YqeC [Desulfobacterium sp.]|nr:putative selenium-dependent hydroxylase accessory protein YqeC [Desulfobacterium sp.]MBU3949267.1 putative selenium-dependent hydroxylase accessory protein YqeC [Pseudomonadota bacterium]MBU4035577.1 putative selenium-dependent hydroxylase accessory protein YqeC [Pseudomonadota bacterium]